MEASLELIKAVQTQVHVPADGQAGPATFKAIYRALTGKDWVDTEATNPSGDIRDVPGFPRVATQMILEAEGLDQPYKWPGGDSGITLGFGCDIGADPDSLAFWEGILTSDQYTRLKSALHVTGEQAHEMQGRFSDIHISREDALNVFYGKSLPREIALTKRTYPGIEKYPAEVLGALTSITYNRGAAMTGDRRAEMRSIQTCIKDIAPSEQSIKYIADKIVEMKRLWGQDQRGLLTRRDTEARLVRSAQLA